MCIANSKRYNINEIDVDKISDEKQTYIIYICLFRKYLYKLIEGMFKYMSSSPIVFVFALILIDRIQ